MTRPRARALVALLPLTLTLTIGAQVTPLVVDLGYAKYAGRSTLAESDNTNNNSRIGTTQWLGMHYAAPPLGPLRFAPPALPLRQNVTQDALAFGPICFPQDPEDWSNKPNKRFFLGEDCLRVNVFAPGNTRGNASEGSGAVAKGLPVLFFIQGGGFVSNSNANYNGSDLARGQEMVVVSVNYRVGAWGFLGGEEEGRRNVAIRDLVRALEWVREHIAKFGGNPDHVVLNGDSAGAMAIVILMASPAIQAKKLFKGAFLESTAAIRIKTPEQAQAQYDCLVKVTGCAYTTNSSSLECLNNLNATTLQTSYCSFGPTFGADIIPSRFLSNNTAYSSALATLPTVFGNTATEGSDAVPKNALLNTTADFRTFFAQRYAFLSDTALDQIVTWYASDKTQPTFPGLGKYYRAASNVITDIELKCPSRAYAGNASWIYEWAVPDPADEASGRGAHHTVELQAIWGPGNADGSPPQSYRPGGVNAGVVPLMQGYVGSFVRSLDPSVGRVEGAPLWERGVDGRTLKIAGVAGNGMGSLGEVEGEGFAERCRRLTSVVTALEVSPEEGVKIDLLE